MDEKQHTAASLRRAAGLNQTGVYDILNGTTRSPKLETLEKLAGALEVSVAYLIGETDVRGEADALLRDFHQMDAESRAQLRMLAAHMAAQRRGVA